MGSTYSFLDVQATLTGPGGSIPLGAGSANAEEGISIEFIEDKDKMLVGADGKVMHSMNASKAGRAIIRLLKTSPVNAQLTQLYTFQTTSSLFFGQNVLVISNSVTGDVYTCKGVAFDKYPNNSYAKEGGILEWGFNVSEIDPVLGSGILPNIF